VLDTISDDGPTWKLEDARFIVEAVSDPDAIFEGLNRLGMEEAVAYSVRPTRDPDEEGEPALPRYGQAFVVYVRQGVGGYVVFDWE
jgi:hypothetical protein